MSETPQRRPMFIAEDDPCQDVRCSRVDGRCVGMHCGKCGEPSSSQGHYGLYCSVTNDMGMFHFCCPDGRCELRPAREVSSDGE